MAAGEIHISDTGTELRFTIKDGSSVVDVSSASSKKLILTDPNNDKTEHDLENVTDGTNGQVKFISEVGDFSVKGVWKGQIKLVLPTGTWYSNVFSFRVYPNL